MMSKNSFWVDIRENNKRRIGLWVISGIFFLLYYLIGITLTISNAKSRIASRVHYADFDKHKVELSETVVNFFTDSLTGMGLTVGTIMAVICAVQGFNYLNKRRQLDFYHSQPVKKGRRFLVTWLNGILIYLIPSFVSVFLAIFIAASQGLLKPIDIGRFVLMYLFYFVLFLAIYHINIIAIMLTGNMLVSLLMMVILHGYEALVYGMQYMYMEEFFMKFVSYYHDPVLFLTPFYWVADGVNPWSIAALPVYATIALLIAYLLYRKRPAEAAGRALVFTQIEPLLKIGLAIPAALMIAMVFWNVTNGHIYADTEFHVRGNGNLLFVAFGIIITTVIVCCFMEVIYEFDIKAALKNKHHILISGIAAAAIFIIFYFDIFGYDRYVPAPHKIKSYALTFDRGIIPESHGNTYFTETGRSIWALPYAEQNMFATDSENITALASLRMQRSTEKATVLYRLKSGRKVARIVGLDYDDPETIPILNRIVSTDEFKKGAFLVFADYFDDWLNSSEMYETLVNYILGPYNYPLTENGLSRLVNAYREDLKGLNFSDMNENRLYGRIQIRHDFLSETVISKLRLSDGQIPDDRGIQEFSNAFSLVVFEGSIRTRAILHEWAIDTNVSLNADDVEYMVVTYRQPRSALEPVIVEYHERFDIERIAENIIYRSWSCCRFCQGGGRDLLAKQNEKDIDVEVYFKEHFKPNAGLMYSSRADVTIDSSSSRYVFLAGKVPDFVWNDVRGR